MVKYLNPQGEGMIDWTDFSWNPVTGCKHGCDYCYMKRLEKRFGYDFTPAFHPERLDAPLKLKQPSKIFVVSAGDLFGEWVPKEWIDSILEITDQCPQHTFQFLTKNPKKYSKFNFGGNCWLGTTIDKEENFFRALDLRFFQRNITYISFEPLLEDIEPTGLKMFGINWIIVGGKTGEQPFTPPDKWIDKIVNYANIQKIPVFLKDNLGYPKRIKKFPDNI